MNKTCNILIIYFCLISNFFFYWNIMECLLRWFWGQNSESGQHTFDFLFVFSDFLALSREPNMEERTNCTEHGSQSASSSLSFREWKEGWVWERGKNLDLRALQWRNFKKNFVPFNRWFLFWVRMSNMVLKTRPDWLVRPAGGYGSDSIWLIESVKGWTGIELVEPAIKPTNCTVQLFFFLKPKKHFDAFYTKTTMFPKRSHLSIFSFTN